MSAPGPVAPEALARLAGLLEEPVVVVDGGCRWEATSSWSALAPNLLVVGFDADAAECKRLAEAHAGDPTLRFVPLALAECSGPVEVHLAREPACSSLFPPEGRALRERPGLRIAERVGGATVEAVSVDDWAEREGLSRIDAIKLDVQGAELAVLRGARRALGGVRALELEVSFNPMYSGQALFADVDAFLREHGFALWRLGHLVHYGGGDAPAVPARADVQFFDGQAVAFAVGEGQLYWAHAYYVAGEIAFREAPADWRARVRDACVCGALGFSDLARWSLRAALAGTPAGAAELIAAALGGPGEPA